MPGVEIGLLALAVEKLAVARCAFERGEATGASTALLDASTAAYDGERR